MSRQLVSLLIIISSLFVLVFVKMEVRRLGYSILKATRINRDLVADHRIKQMNYARLSRPDRIESYAQTYLALHKAQKNQIIPMTPGRVTLRE